MVYFSHGNTLSAMAQAKTYLDLENSRAFIKFKEHFASFVHFDVKCNLLQSSNFNFGIRILQDLEFEVKIKSAAVDL